jgi:hypothetical protein
MQNIFINYVKFNKINVNKQKKTVFYELKQLN